MVDFRSRSGAVPDRSWEASDLGVHQSGVRWNSTCFPLLGSQPGFAVFELPKPKHSMGLPARTASPLTSFQQPPLAVSRHRSPRRVVSGSSGSRHSGVPDPRPDHHRDRSVKVSEKSSAQTTPVVTRRSQGRWSPPQKTCKPTAGRDGMEVLGTVCHGHRCR